MSPAASSSMSRVASSNPSDFYSRKQTRHIKDPIYDLIPVAPYLSAFIDTIHFQRLRNVKQLGTTCYVWPSASHSRFEHCLGVAYLARCLASHLQSSQPELRITDRDVACVEIAGLCHDLGHGPWSHVWDGLFMVAMQGDRPEWTHEEGSEMMLDHLVEKYAIPISEQDKSFVKALIAGDPGKCDPSEKRFLFEIVANKRNGIDVDKFDYIQRDSLMLGESMSISLTRILKSARVIDDEICYNIKDADSIYNIFTARFNLHRRFYNHKTAKAIEYMIVDALKTADSHMKISDRVFDPTRFMYLSDTIMDRIEESTDPELAKAREIFTRIRERDIYRCVDYKVVEWELIKDFKAYITPERIAQAARSLPQVASASQSNIEDIENDRVDENKCDTGDPLDEALEAGDIVVDFAVMHHGMKEKNPLDKVKFYSKNRPDVSMHAPVGVVSTLMPKIFAEAMLRIYTKKPKFFGLAQAGFRTLLEDLDRTIGEAGAEERGTSTRPLTPLSLDGEPHLTDVGTEGTTTRDGSFSTAAGPITPATTSVPLPRTPQGPLGHEKKRPFGRTASASCQPNPFTSVEVGYAAQSPSGRIPVPASKKPISLRKELTFTSAKPHAEDEDDEFMASFAPAPIQDMDESDQQATNKVMVSSLKRGFSDIDGERRVLQEKRQKV